MKILVFLFAIIAIAGCTTTTITTTSGNGIVIEAFGPDLPQAVPGELVNFDVRIRNTGSVTVTNVFGELLGLDEDWYDATEQPYGGGPWEGVTDRWKRPNQLECRSGLGGFTLLPPDPSFGTQGQEHVCTWTYEVPQGILPRGLSLTYNPIIRIFSTTHTEVVKEITILPREELVRLQTQGGALPIDTISSTSSPVSIDVTTNGPTRVIGDKVVFDVTFTIKNQNDGIVCSEIIDIHNTCNHRNPNAPNADPKWNELIFSVVDQSNLQFTDCIFPMKISLFKGERNSITCEMTLSGVQSNVPVTQTIRVRADYSYLTDKESAITITN